MAQLRIGRLSVSALAVAGAMLSGGGADAAEPLVATLPAPKTETLTVYQNGLGMIEDQRPVTVAQPGPFRLTFTGIAPSAIAGGAQATAEGLNVQRQRYRLRPLSQQLILERSVGKTVQLIRTHPQTGAETVEEAELIALDGGRPILKVGDRIELDPPGRIALKSLGGDLTNRPAVVAIGQAETAGDKTVAFRYLVGGVSWQASYVVTLSGSDAQPTVSLGAWADVFNGSGMELAAKPVRLVAGELRRVSPGGQQPMAEAAPRMMAMAMDTVAAAPPEATGDAHVYTLDARATLPPNQVAQLKIFDLPGLAAERRYVLEGNGRMLRMPSPGAEFQNPAVEIRFANTGGVPLPSGIARIFGPLDGGELLLGESPIPSTPKGEKVTLRTGSAFDITVRRQQTAYQLIGPPDNAFETGHKLTFANAKDADVTIEVREAVGGDWEMVEESQPHVRDGLTSVWQVTVPAGGSAILTYKVRVRR